jgi:hypothetical protein
MSLGGLSALQAIAKIQSQSPSPPKAQAGVDAAGLKRPAAEPVKEEALDEEKEPEAKKLKASEPDEIPAENDDVSVGQET